MTTKGLSSGCFTFNGSSAKPLGLLIRQNCDLIDPLLELLLLGLNQPIDVFLCFVDLLFPFLHQASVHLERQSLPNVTLASQSYAFLILSSRSLFQCSFSSFPVQLKWPLNSFSGLFLLCSFALRKGLFDNRPHPGRPRMHLHRHICLSLWEACYQELPFVWWPANFKLSVQASHGDLPFPVCQSCEPDREPPSWQGSGLRTPAAPPATSTSPRGAARSAGIKVKERNAFTGHEHAPSHKPSWNRFQMLSKQIGTNSSY